MQCISPSFKESQKCFHRRCAMYVRYSYDSPDFFSLNSTHSPDALSFSRNLPLRSRTEATIDLLIFNFSVFKQVRYLSLFVLTILRYAKFPGCLSAVPPRPQSTSASRGTKSSAFERFAASALEDLTVSGAGKPTVLLNDSIFV